MCAKKAELSKKQGQVSHEGHRIRLRTKLMKGGIDLLEPHEALVFFLFYAYPRRNTNPIAHTILEQDEYFYAKLRNADSINDEQYEKLSAVDKYFNLLGKCAVKYMAEKEAAANAPALNVTYEDYLLRRFMGMGLDCYCLYLFDCFGREIYNEILPSKKIENDDFPIKQIARICNSGISGRPVFVRFIPNESVTRIPLDFFLKVRKLDEILDSYGTKLYDAIIVSQSNSISMVDCRFLPDDKKADEDDEL